MITPEPPDTARCSPSLPPRGVRRCCGPPGPKKKSKKSSPPIWGCWKRWFFTKLVLVMATTVGFSFSATSAMGGRRSIPLASTITGFSSCAWACQPWLSPMPRAMHPAAKTDNPKTCFT